MALPESRDYDATDGGPLAATVVNNLQDAVVANKHGAIDIMIGAGKAKADPSDNAAWNASGWWELGTAGAVVVLPLDLPVGARIDEITIYGQDTAAGELRCNLYEIGVDGVSNFVSSNEDSGTTNGIVAVALTTGLPYTVVVTEFPYVSVQINGTPSTGVQVYGVRVQAVKP